MAVMAGVGLVMLQPARSTALAEATAKGRKGDVAMRQEGGQVTAETAGDAPSLAGTDERAPTADPRPGQPAQATPATGQLAAAGQAPAKERVGSSGGGPAEKAGGTSFRGKLLGLAGMVVAALLLRRESSRVAQDTKA